MLTLALVEKNPTGDAVVALIGVGMLLVLAAVLVALWIFVARKAARPDEADAADPALAKLRKWRLVFRRPRGPGRADAPKVSALDGSSGSEPASR
jgi:hypothetical protein